MTQGRSNLSFLGHLDELRERLLKLVGAVFLCTLIFYAFVDHVLAWMIKPIGQLVFTSPSDAFLARIYLSIVGGIILALPVIIYQIWKFIASGLKENEKYQILIFAPASFFLFLIGCMFAYFVVVPIALKFFLGFSSEYIVPMITIKNYISFVGMMIFAFGIIFELPLALLFLTRIGIATPEFLIQKRKHAIVLILIVSALITPPDVVTQILMSGPLILLYEVGVLVSKMTYRRNKFE